MPIRQGGVLASRASTWPRDHFCRSTMAPRLSGSDDVERVLANIDASNGDCGVEFRRHSVLLVFGAPCQRNLLAGQEHGRTIPLTDIGRIEIPQRSSACQAVLSCYELIGGTCPREETPCSKGSGSSSSHFSAARLLHGRLRRRRSSRRCR